MDDQLETTRRPRPRVGRRHRLLQRRRLPTAAGGLEAAGVAAPAAGRRAGGDINSMGLPNRILQDTIRA
jgi:hypothetical protein